MCTGEMGLPHTSACFSMPVVKHWSETLVVQQILPPDFFRWRCSHAETRVLTLHGCISFQPIHQCPEVGLHFGHGTPHRTF